MFWQNYEFFVWYKQKWVIEKIQQHGGAVIVCTEDKKNDIEKTFLEYCPNHFHVCQSKEDFEKLKLFWISTEYNKKHISENCDDLELNFNEIIELPAFIQTVTPIWISLCSKDNYFYPPTYIPLFNKPTPSIKSDNQFTVLLVGAQILTKNIKSGIQKCRSINHRSLLELALISFNISVIPAAKSIDALTAQKYTHVLWSFSELGTQALSKSANQNEIAKLVKYVSEQNIPIVYYQWIWDSYEYGSCLPIEHYTLIPSKKIDDSESWKPAYYMSFRIKHNKFLKENILIPSLFVPNIAESLTPKNPSIPDILKTPTQIKEYFIQEIMRYNKHSSSVSDFNENHYMWIISSEYTFDEASTIYNFLCELFSKKMKTYYGFSSTIISLPLIAEATEKHILNNYEKLLSYTDICIYNMANSSFLCSCCLNNVLKSNCITPSALYITKNSKSCYADAQYSYSFLANNIQTSQEYPEQFLNCNSDALTNWKQKLFNYASNISASFNLKNTLNSKKRTKKIPVVKKKSQKKKSISGKKRKKENEDLLINIQSNKNGDTYPNDKFSLFPPNISDIPQSMNSMPPTLNIATPKISSQVSAIFGANSNKFVNTANSTHTNEKPLIDWTNTCISQKGLKQEFTETNKASEIPNNDLNWSILFMEISDTLLAQIPKLSFNSLMTSQLKNQFDFKYIILTELMTILDFVEKDDLFDGINGKSAFEVSIDSNKDLKQWMEVEKRTEKEYENMKSSTRLEIQCNNMNNFLKTITSSLAVQHDCVTCPAK